MKMHIRCFPILIGIILYAIPVHGKNITTQNLGEVGGGIFIPTGNDADVARSSPVVQLGGSALITPRFGFEAEFHYVPVLLKDDILTTAAHRKATQMALMGGLRVTTHPLLQTQSFLIGYLAARAGFARITIRTDGLRPTGGWIGRPIDELENPPSGINITQTTHQKGLVLSPKAGALFKISERAFLDVALTPMLIFDQGDVTTQFYITLSYGLSARSTF